MKVFELGLGVGEGRGRNGGVEGDVVRTVLPGLLLGDRRGKCGRAGRGEGELEDFEGVRWVG